MKAVVHIAPQLPPAVDGVGDYCRNLWRHRPEPLADWKFLVRRGAEATARAWPEIEVRQFEGAGDALLEALEAMHCRTAVLHYVGYGFQPKGIPVWLPRAIAAWKRADRRRRLITMFHEMYARSSPLRSPFWVAPIARRIIRQLVESSDSWITSCERYFTQLTTEFSAAPELGETIPIGSNIARAGTRAAPCARDSFRVAVFGLPRTRLWALQRHWRLLRALNQAAALHSITLLGQPNAAADERLWLQLKSMIGAADVRWKLRFNLPPDEISRELLEHDVGLLPNDPGTLTKSGVFAAFATHGVIPIVSQRTPAPRTSPLSSVIIPNDEDENISELQQMLAEPARAQQRREMLLAFAARELSWSRIARNWSHLLEPHPTDAETHRSIASQHEHPGPARARSPSPFLTQP